MKNNTKVSSTDVSDLVDDARALLAATANIADHKVERARKRLNAALQRGKSAGEDIVDSSADIAGDNIKEILDRITAALDRGKEIYEDVHDDVMERAKAADHKVRKNPYKVMGIALGVGTVIGFLLSPRNSRNGH